MNWVQFEVRTFYQKVKKICGDARDPFGSPEVQAPLKEKEVSCAAASGSIFVYGIDVYHRGTNLTLLQEFDTH